MTVRVNKSAFNIREKLSELERPIGVKGNELMRAETVQDARDLVSAGRKNLIINGSLQVNQRGFTSSAAANDNAFIADRMIRYQSGMTTGAATDYLQTLTSSDAPTQKGIKYAFRRQVTATETSLGAGVDTQFWFKLEAQTTDFAGWGTSAAQDMSLSFWVKSHVAGRYYIWVHYNDGANAYYVTLPYDVGSTNSWEHKSVIVPKFTQGQVQTRTNELGLFFTFYTAAGTNFSGSGYNKNWASVSSARVGSDAANIYAATGNFYLTGFQLEVGKNATEFEHRSYGEELALCQRYCQRLGPDDGTSASHYNSIASGWLRSGSILSYSLQTQTDLPVRMRTIPTASVGGGTNTFYAQYGGTAITCSFSNLNTQGSTPQKVWIDFQPSSTAGTDGLRVVVGSDNSNGGQANYIILSAEL